MGISSLLYTIGQGFRNIRRNSLFTLASMATIASCLFLFGLFYAIILNFQHIVQAAEENVSVTVFFNEGVTEEEMLQLKIAIEERDEVKEVNYTSAEAAWESFKEYLGDGADTFTENPLENCASLEIFVSDVSRQSDLVAYLQNLEAVRSVNYSEITATTLSGFNRLAAYIYIGIVVILLAVSVFLISNTVTIGIAVRKEEISIMKYIGATDFFVRAPFVVEGIIIGLLGSIIPVFAINYIYQKAVEYITSRFSILTQIMSFLPAQTVTRNLAVISIALGVGIGFFGSLITVRRHIRV